MSDYYDGSVRTELRRLTLAAGVCVDGGAKRRRRPGSARVKLRFLQDHIVGGIENDAADAVSERDHRFEGSRPPGGEGTPTAPRRDQARRRRPYRVGVRL